MSDLHEALLGAARLRLLADTILSTWAPGNKPIDVRCTGVRYKTDPKPPYIRLTLDGDFAVSNFEKVRLLFEVYDDRGSVQRREIYRVIRSLFHAKRLSNQGVAALRLNQAYVSDGVPDRTVGSVKLVAGYTGEAVLDPRTYNG